MNQLTLENDATITAITGAGTSGNAGNISLALPVTGAGGAVAGAAAAKDRAKGAIDRVATKTGRTAANRGATTNPRLSGPEGSPPSHLLWTPFFAQPVIEL